MPAEIKQTTCVMDCPDSCALDVEVEDGRVLSIAPGADHPDTAGFICSKVANFSRRLYHADRVLHPMRRVGAKGEGRFERVSWDAAIDEITTRFREIAAEHGAEAILPFHYGGSNGMLSDELLDYLYFARLGASRLEKTICAVPATEVAVGMYGKMPGVAFADYVNARCIVIWGANPRGSNIHLLPYLREAKRRGATIFSVDPRRRLSAAEHDLHLPVLPGQDLPLALALIRWWEERGALDRDFLASHADGLEPLLARACEWSIDRASEASGVAASSIESLASALMESEPAVVRCGWGIERNANGGQAVAAVLAIPALLGKFGVRGGGYTLSNGGALSFDDRPIIGDLDWRTRLLNMTQLGRLLGPELDPPIRAMLVYNANPVATVPEQDTVRRRLERDDLFTVVHEQVMTDTALYADLLLPAATFLEGWDLRGGYGSYMLGGIRPVVPAAGEARTNMQLFAELGRAMGFDEPAFHWDDETLMRKVIEQIEIPGGSADADRLAGGGIVRYDFPGGGPVQFENVHPRTPDGKIHLTPATLGDRPFEWRPPANGAPLSLITPASSKLVTSTMGEYNVDVLHVTLHPSDAATRGLERQARVRVFNERGEVHCLLAVSDRVRPGVASMPKGAWQRSSINGATSVALCPDDAQVVGNAACFNDARVEVARLDEASSSS
jgi:anaerobic selenocysteine-containing dehydrogenase